MLEWERVGIVGIIPRELQGMGTVSVSRYRIKVACLSNDSGIVRPSTSDKSPKCRQKESSGDSHVTFSRENVGDSRTSHAYLSLRKSRERRTTGWPAARRENQRLTDKQIGQERHAEETRINERAASTEPTCRYVQRSTGRSDYPRNYLYQPQETFCALRCRTAIGITPEKLSQQLYTRYDRHIVTH